MGVGPPLLRADEVLELARVTYEEDRRIVADQIVVAVLGVELDRETTRVADRVSAAKLPGHGGEPDEHVGALAHLGEERGPGVPGDLRGHLEIAVRAAPFGVNNALGHPLPVELRHLLEQIVILKQQRAIRAD